MVLMRSVTQTIMGESVVGALMDFLAILTWNADLKRRCLQLQNLPMGHVLLTITARLTKLAIKTNVWIRV